MTHEHHTHTHPEASDNKLVPLAIIVAGALVALAIYFGGSNDAQIAGTNNNPSRVDANSLTVEKVSANDHIIGSPNAKVIVVEYSDTECPFCKTFHNTMHQIVNSYSADEVAWVYRHFPIANLHPNAAKEAEATECAAEQGGNAMFWKFTDELYRVTPSNNKMSLDELPKIAATVGLDVTKFNECLSSGKYAQAIQDDIVAAQKAGARGTPHSVILSGKEKVLINGAEPFESVKAKIDTLLKK